MIRHLPVLRLLSLLLALPLLPATIPAAHAQSPGTLSLSGPSTGGQTITPASLSAAVNAALAKKADVASPTFTGTVTAPSVAITSGTISGADVSGANVTPSDTGIPASLANAISARLPLSGGTLTGALTVPGVNNTGSETVAGTLGVTGAVTFSRSLQFGGSTSAALANDGASNDIVVNPAASVPNVDTDFVLYPPSAAGAYLVVNSVGGANQQQLILGSSGNVATHYIFSQAVAGTGSYLPIQFNGGSTDAFTLTTAGSLQLDNHLSAVSSALPSVSLTSCGTSPSGSAANDVRGTIVIGTGTVTACTVTFHTAYASTPTVVLTGLGTGSTVLSLSADSTTGFTISASASIGGEYVNYVVVQ